MSTLFQGRTLKQRGFFRDFRRKICKVGTQEAEMQEVCSQTAFSIRRREPTISSEKFASSTFKRKLVPHDGNRVLYFGLKGFSELLSYFFFSFF